MMRIISCKLLKNKQTTVQRSEYQPPQPDGRRSLAREKTGSPSLNFLFVLDPALFGRHWSPQPSCAPAAWSLVFRELKAAFPRLTFGDRESRQRSSFLVPA